MATSFYQKSGRAGRLSQPGLDEMRSLDGPRESCLGEKAAPVGRNRAPPPAEPPRWDAGLHVEEQRARAPTGRLLTLTALGVLTRLLAILAADGEGQRAETLLGDFLTAIEAVAVVALLEPMKRVVDLVERFRLHLDQRELEIFLNVGLGALDRVEHFVQLAAPGAFLAHAAHLA